MSYQPLYATVQDVNGVRSSHSCRRKVEWIGGWLNSDLGEVMGWDAYHRDKVILVIRFADDVFIEADNNCVRAVLPQSIADEVMRRLMSEHPANAG